MRLHLEWSEGLCLCFLFADDAGAVRQMQQHASDAWQWRTAPLMHLEPTNPDGADTVVLTAISQHLDRLHMTRAPCWVSLLAQDAPGQAGWDRVRAAVLARLNEAREWLVKDFARPLVLCLPVSWQGRVPSIAPDLWHVRAFTAHVHAPARHVVPSVLDALPLATQLHDAPPPDVQTALDAVTVARKRAAAQPGQSSLLREQAVALGDLGDVFLSTGAVLDALVAYRESLGILRQLREQLGDSPQVLDDLAGSLVRCGAVQACPLPEQRACLQEAVALQEQLVAALQSERHRQRLRTAQDLLSRCGDAADTVVDR